MRMKCGSAVIILTYLLFLATAGYGRPQLEVAHPVLLIKNVTLIDGTGTAPRNNVSVLISDGKIVEIGDPSAVKVPKSAFVIDGSGKFLIPGLWDMHVHTLYESGPTRYFPLLIANGVTSVRDMNGPLSIAEINGLRKQIRAGEVLGPTIFAPGPLIDGPRPPRAMGPNVVSVKTEEEARAAVRDLKKQGADFIKIYNRITPALLASIADESKKQDIPFVGHIPHQVAAKMASEAGIASIEHFSGVLEGASLNEEALLEISRAILSGDNPPLADQMKVVEARKEILTAIDEKKLRDLIDRFLRNKTWQTPTLVSNRILAWPPDEPQLLKDERLRYVTLETEKEWSANGLGRRLLFGTMKDRYPKILEIVGLMNRAGVRFLAGTDLGVAYVFAGSSLHDELELFVKAGLTPMEALQTATKNPAEFMGVGNSVGTLEKGKVADIVILDANPLSDIKNIRKLDAVILRGRYIGRKDLDSLKTRLERPSEGR